MIMKNNKGITLIALIITIIVMLILVSVTITVAVNGGLFNYARKASVDTNTRVNEEQTLASGIFGGKRIEDWVEGGESLLPGATIPAKETEESNGTNGVYLRMATAYTTGRPTVYYSKVTDTEKAIINAACSANSIPYTFGDFTYGGNKVPEGPIQTMDCYLYGDYIYAYNCEVNRRYLEGWEVIVWDPERSQTSYGELLNSINGEDLTHVYETFYNCTNLIQAPRIPDSVTDMDGAFLECTSLTTVPNIPNSLINMEGTFYGCTSLTTAPNIPNSVTDMISTFEGCTSLTTVSNLPNNVTDMWNTFNLCTSLTTVPNIPSSVANMDSTFEGCESLKGTITINANPSSYSACFYECSKDSAHSITLTGSASLEILNALKATGYNNGQFITVAPSN